MKKFLLFINLLVISSSTIASTVPFCDWRSFTVLNKSIINYVLMDGSSTSMLNFGPEFSNAGQDPYIARCPGEEGNVTFNITDQSSPGGYSIYKYSR